MQLELIGLQAVHALRGLQDRKERAARREKLLCRSRNARLFEFEKAGDLPIIDVRKATTEPGGLNYSVQRRDICGAGVEDYGGSRPFGSEGPCTKR